MPRITRIRCAVRGGLNAGSGKLGTPWLRMHRARARAAARSAAEVAGGAALLGRNCLHACRADRNAGDSGLTFGGRSMPPPAVGSGKFVTPCERMHCGNSKSRVLSPDAPLAEPV